MNEYQRYLEFAKSVAYEAGEIMRKYFGKNPDSEFKEDDTIVTVADKEINNMVIERVKVAFPKHAINGEEASYAQDTKHVWVCDPIDGTNPFAMALAVSVFSLAYVYDGEPLVGVVYDPFTDRMFWAVKGGGAFINEDRTYVNAQGFEPKARINFDWWSNAEYDVLTPLIEISKRTGAYLLSPGSATHAAVLVAQGDFVASVFPGTKGKCVDIAAAKVIVEEAGGKVTDLFGEEQRYDGDIRGTIVSNGVVHDELVELIQQSATCGFSEDGRSHEP